MKMSCTSNLLQKSISIVEKAVSQRTALPVLENILFRVKNNQLALVGNDLEIAIEHRIPIQSEGEGTFLVKGKTISSIVSKLQNQELLVDVDSASKCTIKSDNIDFDILCVNPDEYPQFPVIENGVKIKLTVAELRQLIKYTLFAVSFDETKQFLNGILMKYEDGFLYFISTDGYRLSLKRQKIEVLQAPTLSAIVPFKAVNELNKILQSYAADQVVELNVSENQVSFSMQDFVLVSRVIQGQFPDYKHVLPKESENQFSVVRRFLLDASERANIIASASNNVVRMQFGQQLVLKANAASLGDFKELIEIMRLKGESEIKIAFNIRLVLDVIRVMESEDIKIEFNSEVSPCVIRPMQDDDFAYIIMPIRTSDYVEQPQATAAAVA
ncbi:MAG: DNA polymerase III subunit beta [Candidatus Margulisiibacteriota bacterium]